MLLRPATSEDHEALLALDASFETTMAWQMEQRQEGEEVITSFRPIRLPRSIKVEPPWSQEELREAWEGADLLLVAEESGELLGFLDMAMEGWRKVGWIQHLAVAQRQRRKGVGSSLMEWARGWGRRRDLRGLVLEVQTKNYPGIAFLQKNGFSFCGFNDQLYPSKDIALYFFCPLG